MDTSIKSYCNHHGYTDVTPYEVVRVVSDKTVDIRRMKSELNPEWKPNVLPGGFMGRCVNQVEQKWIITPDTSAPVIKARLNKEGWKSAYGKHKMNVSPLRFYDYNF
jgi:hypothetical protein